MTNAPIVIARLAALHLADLHRERRAYRHDEHHVAERRARRRAERFPWRRPA